jgi:hypothetical protein
MSDMDIGIRQALLNLRRLDSAYETLTRRLSTGKRINSVKDDPTGWVRVNRNRYAQRAHQSINAGLGHVARNIRVADVTMKMISDYIDQMREQLEIVVKNYPPFPPGSEERVRMLRTFNSFRKQIDQLTIPPRDDGARKIMADPSVVPDAGDWVVSAGLNGVRFAIRSQQVHTGPTGLNIQELPEDATDDEVYAAIDSLIGARDVLRQRQAALQVDAATVARYASLNSTMAAHAQDVAERTESADMTEVTAQVKSTELRRELAIESLRSLTQSASQLISLFG